MSFRVDITDRAQSDIDDLARYTIDEENRIVNVRRVWRNTARDPDQFHE
jgi:plasmid stabilization system protein ParE